MSTGEKIKKARILKGLTQKALGISMGLTDDRIGHYEMGRRTPKEKVLQKIADCLGFSREYFTDHSIESYADVMHTFFDIKNTYGMTIQKLTDNNGKQNTIDSRPAYVVTFEDERLSERMNKWIETIDNIWYQHYKNRKSTLEDVEKECQLWEGRYPLLHADDSTNKLREERKKESKLTQEE